MLAAPAPRIVTPLYPQGVVASAPGTSVVTSDPHGNRAGLAARCGIVARRNFNAGEREHSRFVIRAYNPTTGDVWVQHETGSAVHRVNRDTGKCDCADAVKGQTKQLRMACIEAGLNPDELPENAIPTDAPTALYCKHYWVLGGILTGILRYEQANFGSVELALRRMPTDLPRKFWVLCPSKQTTKEYGQ